MFPSQATSHRKFAVALVYYYLLWSTSSCNLLDILVFCVFLLLTRSRLVVRDSSLCIFLCACRSFSRFSPTSLSSLIQLTTYNNVLVRLRTSFVFRTGAYFLFIFEPLGGFDPPMAQTKALAGAITERHCSIVDDMSSNGFKMHLG